MPVDLNDQLPRRFRPSGTRSCVVAWTTPDTLRNYVGDWSYNDKASHVSRLELSASHLFKLQMFQKLTPGSAKWKHSLPRRRSLRAIIASLQTSGVSRSSFLAISFTSGVMSLTSKLKTYSPIFRLGISSRSDRRASLTANVITKLKTRIRAMNPTAACNWDVGRTNCYAVCPGKQHLRLDHGRFRYSLFILSFDAVVRAADSVSKHASIKINHLLSSA